MKGEKNVFILRNIEKKAFNKIQHIFLLKAQKTITTNGT